MKYFIHRMVGDERRVSGYMVCALGQAHIAEGTTRRDLQRFFAVKFGDSWAARREAKAYGESLEAKS